MGGSFPNPLCNRAVICTSFSFHLVSIVASFSVALLHGWTSDCEVKDSKWEPEGSFEKYFHRAIARKKFTAVTV